MALVIRLLGGLSVWAAGFGTIYAAHGLGCELGWGSRSVIGPFTTLNLVLASLWLIFLALTLVLLRLTTRDDTQADSPALQRAGMIVGWAGLIGILLTGLPLLLPAHCL